MKEAIVIFLLVSGAVFILLSAVGLLRMPDLYTRLSVTTKANTLGIGAILTALIIFFESDLSILTRSLTALIFILITIPVAGHFLARVAYFIGIEKQQGSEKDALHKKFGSMKKPEEKEKSEKNSTS